MSWITDLFDYAQNSLEDFVTNLLEQFWRDFNNMIDEIGRALDKVMNFVVDYWMYIVLVIILIVGWYYSPYYISMMTAYEVGGGITYASVMTYATSLQLYFAYVLESIYFATLLKIHSIAFIVSADYRNMISGLYQHIGQLSLAIGLGAESMYLFYHNARALVLDASTAMGMSYDLAEINWLRTFAEYSKTVKDKMLQYKGNPGMFLQDIGQLIEKPYLDAKASFTQAVLSTIDGSLKLVKDTVVLITMLENDVKRLVADLPEFLRTQVQPELNRVTRQIDDFVKLNYDPAMRLISGSLAVLQQDQAVAKRQIQGTIDRLVRPGKYLKEVEYLDVDEQREDYAAIAEVATYTTRDEFSEYDLAHEWAAKKLVIEELARLRVPEAPEILRLEPSGPKLPGPPRPDKTDTPFVGDY